MARRPNTDIIGKPFPYEIITKVWEKGKKIDNPDIDSTYIRKDKCGATIAKSDYGNTNKYRWEIDHIKPVSNGGTDDLSNLQPLHWENNRHKGENYPDWSCLKK